MGEIIGAWIKLSEEPCVCQHPTRPNWFTGNTTCAHQAKWRLGDKFYCGTHKRVVELNMRDPKWTVYWLTQWEGQPYFGLTYMFFDDEEEADIALWKFDDMLPRKRPFDPKKDRRYLNQEGPDYERR